MKETACRVFFYYRLEYTLSMNEVHPTSLNSWVSLHNAISALFILHCHHLSITCSHKAYKSMSKLVILQTMTRVIVKYSVWPSGTCYTDSYLSLSWWQLNQETTEGDVLKKKVFYDTANKKVKTVHPMRTCTNLFH